MPSHRTNSQARSATPKASSPAIGKEEALARAREWGMNQKKKKSLTPVKKTDSASGLRTTPKQKHEETTFNSQRAMSVSEIEKHIIESAKAKESEKRKGKKQPEIANPSLLQSWYMMPDQSISEESISDSETANESDFADEVFMDNATEEKLRGFVKLGKDAQANLTEVITKIERHDAALKRLSEGSEAISDLFRDTTVLHEWVINVIKLVVHRKDAGLDELMSIIDRNTKVDMECD